MTITTLEGSCVTYFMCMFCKDVALNYYPEELHFILTGSGNCKGNLYVGMTACYTCTRDPSNYDTIRYYVHNEIDISYVKSTCIYNVVKDKYKTKPTIIIVDQNAGLLDIDNFVEGLTNKCALYSVTYTSENISRTSPKTSFYGTLASK